MRVSSHDSAASTLVGALCRHVAWSSSPMGAPTADWRVMYEAFAAPLPTDPTDIFANPPTYVTSSIFAIIASPACSAVFEARFIASSFALPPLFRW